MVLAGAHTFILVGVSPAPTRKRSAKVVCSQLFMGDLEHAWHVAIEEGKLATGPRWGRRQYLLFR